MLRNVAFLVFAALLLGLASARTFRCDEVWPNGPSPANQAQDCLGDQDHMQKLLGDSDHLPHMVLAVIPLFFFLVGFLCCPVVCCSRYTCKCCGSYRRRPETFCCGGAEWDLATAEEKEAKYMELAPGSVRNTKVCAVIVLMLGIAMLLLGVSGASLLNKQYLRAFTETKGVLRWVDERSVNIRTVMTINETGSLIPPLTEGFFDNISSKVNEFRGKIDDTKTKADPYVEKVNAVAIAISVIPILFLIITVICAVCDIRRVVLCCNLVCHWFFLIPYGLLGFVFLATALVVGDLCGERDLFLQDPNGPGLISLAVVPLCEDNAPFESAKVDINNVVVTQAQRACTVMLTICDGSAAYNPITEPNKVFQCAGLTDPATQCNSFAEASSFANAMVLKPNGYNECRQNVSDPGTAFTPCTLQRCASSCSVADIRNSSAQVLTALSYTVTAEYAYRAFVEPLLSCATLFTQGLRPLVVCHKLVLSTQLAGGSFLGYSALFVIGMVVIWRGQKRFFKVPSQDEDDEDVKAMQDQSDDFGSLSVASKEMTLRRSNASEPTG